MVLPLLLLLGMMGRPAWAGPTPRATEAAQAEAARLAFPQDYALAVAAARAWDRTVHTDRAVTAWRAAGVLSDGSLEVRSGLAAALLADGRPEAARRVALSVLDQEPSHPTARTTLALSHLSGRPWRLRGGMTWATAPTWTNLNQTWTAWADARWFGDLGVRVNLGYRFTGQDMSAPGVSDVPPGQAGAPPVDARSGQPTQPTQPNGGQAAPFRAAFSVAGHQATFGLGYARPAGGVSADGLLLIDSASGTLGGTGLLSGRVRVYGDLIAVLGVSTYADGLLIGTGTLAWTLPLGPYVTLTPAFLGQLEDGVPSPAGALTLGAGGLHVGGWVAGRYGRQVRQVMSDPVAIADLPAPTSWAAAAGLRIGPFGPFRLDVAYTLDNLLTEDGDHLLHGIAVTLSGIP